MTSPSARDLVTILYQPRETMRRILDSGRARWTAEVVVLAYICGSVTDLDMRHLGERLPDLALGSTLAFVALVLIVLAACWVIAIYAFSWLVAFVGKYLDGHGTYADVRAAMAWGLVPMVWSVVYRIPISFYRSKLKIVPGGPVQMSIDFIQGGGCSLALIVLLFQLAFFVWIVFVESSTVAEAMHVETWKGLSALAISVAIPVVVVIAAVLSFKH